jgi:hypothetical protein
MSTNDKQFGQVRHWLVTGVSIKEGGELVVPSEATISPYMGPASEPGAVDSRLHRYVFILARPQASTGGGGGGGGGPATGKVDITAAELREKQKPYPMAMSGNQRVNPRKRIQELRDRWGFNTHRLIKEHGLRVEAVTYMLVVGKPKSAAANVGMMGGGGG